MANRKLQSLMNVSSVSQFSRNNATRDYRIFEEIFYYLVDKAKRRHDVARLLKVSTLFNGEYLEKINIVKGQVDNRKCIDGLFEDKGSIYVFDKCYYDYRWYDKLTEQGIRFVTRGTKNASVIDKK